MQKLAVKWEQKYVGLKNFLDIKFATHNEEATVPHMKDYEITCQMLDLLSRD